MLDFRDGCRDFCLGFGGQGLVEEVVWRLGYQKLEFGLGAPALGLDVWIFGFRV